MNIIIWFSIRTSRLILKIIFNRRVSQSCMFKIRLLIDSSYQWIQRLKVYWLFPVTVTVRWKKNSRFECRHSGRKWCPGWQFWSTISAEISQWETDLRLFSLCNFHQLYEYLVVLNSQIRGWYDERSFLQENEIIPIFPGGHINRYMKSPLAMEMFGWSQKLWHLWSMNYIAGDHRLWWQWWHFILCLRMSSRVCFTYELWYNIFTMHASYCNIAIFNENFNYLQMPISDYEIIKLL